MHQFETCQPDARHPAERLVVPIPRTSVKPPDWQFAGKSIRVLFLCRSNSARSQMAEALLRHLSPEQEACPVFPSSTEVITWTVRDPLRVQGTSQERSRAFDLLAIELNTRIRLLLTLLEREKRASI